MMKKWIFLAVVGIALWGGYLRFESLAKQSFWIDEGFSVTIAGAIREHGSPLLDSGHYSWRAFPTHYLMSLGMSLFGNIHFGARFFPALTGTLLIGLFYLFNFRIFRSRPQALIATALMAFMTYEIAWSRQARMYIFLQFFMTGCLYCYYRFLEEKNRLMLFLAFLFGALAIYTHQAGYLTGIIILLTTLIDVQNWRSWRTWVAGHKYFLLLFSILIAFFIYSLTEVSSDSSLQNTAMNIVGSQKPDYDLNYSATYLRFLFEQLHLFLALGVMGIFLIFWKKHLRYTLAIVAGTVLFFWFISFQNLLFHSRYLLPILPFLLLLIAHALSLGWTALQKYPLPIRLLATALTAAVIAQAQLTVFPPTAYDLGFSAPQPDWRAAYQWVQEYEHDAAVTTISTFPMFHDIYFGKDTGQKYFLPLSMSGLSGSGLVADPYSDAVPVNDADMLKNLKGYVILDTFGFNALTQEDVSAFLREQRPAKVIGRGRNALMIWIL